MRERGRGRSPCTETAALESPIPVSHRVKSIPHFLKKHTIGPEITILSRPSCKTQQTNLNKNNISSKQREKGRTQSERQQVGTRVRNHHRQGAICVFAFGGDTLLAESDALRQTVVTEATMASSTSATNAATSTPLSSNLGLYNSSSYASAYAQRYAQLGSSNRFAYSLLGVQIAPDQFRTLGS